MKKELEPWFKPRGYLHFDVPIGYAQAKKIVTNPTKVQQHSFYPFISYSISSKKIKKNKETGKIEEKHKNRPIAYAAHVDSHIYSYYSHLLGEKYEEILENKGISDNVLAFRKLGKNNVHFANLAFEEIIKKQYCSAVALDITKFFERLDHQILKKVWATVLDKPNLPKDHYNIFKSLTRYSEVEREELYKLFGISKNNPKNGRVRICDPIAFRKVVRGKKLIKTRKEKRGIPQGSPISALLSNIYMLDFDIAIKSFMDSINGVYLRYCDDILCIAPLDYVDSIEKYLIKEIDTISLDINTDKTKKHEFRVIHGKLQANIPLQYLGFMFDGQHKIIRSASLARFSEKMKAGVRLAKATEIKRNNARVKKGLPTAPLYKQKLYARYSHLGPKKGEKRNFVFYGLRSAKIMNSPAIKKQLKPLWLRLKKEIEKA